MHILLVTHHFAPENNAPRRRWDALGARFAAAGHRLTVVTPPPHYPSGSVTREDRAKYGPGRVHRTDYGATVLRTNYTRHRADIGTRTVDHMVAAVDSLRRVRRHLQPGEAPDVVIATVPGIPSMLAGRMIAKHYSVPLITEMRDAWPDLVTHTPGFTSVRGPVSAAKRLIHAAVTRWQRDSARVVTTSSRFADVLAERGIREPVVIRNGTSLDLFGHIPTRQPDGTFHALYMGNMGRSQGLDTVVRAAAVLRDEGVQIVVRLIGHGAEKPALERLNAELGSPVEILPQVPAEDVREHYGWADTLIVSLRDWEPFQWTVPSKLYEVLATGRHVTGLLAGEAADVLSQSGAGDLLPPGSVDALTALWRDLIADPERVRATSGGEGWIRANANYDALAQHYLQLLDEVAG